jgi:hypothetical protein
MTYRTQISSGTVSNLPPNKIGSLYMPINGGALYENNGTSWQNWAQSYPINIPTANNTNFGWLSQGTASKAFSSTGLVVTVSGGLSAQPSVLQNNTNITSGFVEVGALSLTSGALTSSSAYMTWSALMYNYASSNFVLLNCVFDINNASNISYINYSGSVLAGANNSLVPMSGPVFLKLAIVSGNILLLLSRDRVNYEQILSTSLSTALGSGLTSSTFYTGVNVGTAGSSTGYTNTCLIFHYLQG